MKTKTVRNALQRLSMTLMLVMLTTMTAWAYTESRTYTFSTNSTGSAYLNQYDASSNPVSNYLLGDQSAQSYTTNTDGNVTVSVDFNGRTGGVIDYSSNYYAYNSGYTNGLWNDSKYYVTISSNKYDITRVYLYCTNKTANSIIKVENNETKSIQIEVPQSESVYRINVGLYEFEWSGSGTENDPWKITCTRDLEELRDRVNNGTNYYNKYFKQTADITLSGQWTPIGNSSNVHEFHGTYDGDGKTISGLTVSGYCAGLFGYVSSYYDYQYTQTNYRSLLKNIVIVGCNITGTSGGYAGGLAGYISSVDIVNCQVSGTITSVLHAGGLVGYDSNSSSTLTDCFADVHVESERNDRVGALVGGKIKKSDSSGNRYHTTQSGVNALSATDLFGYSLTDADAGATRVYTVTSATSGLTVSETGAYVPTLNGTRYYAAGTTVTVTPDDADMGITSFNVTSGTISDVSIASDGHSATFTVGSSDVTVTATFKTTSGSCGDGVTWRMSDENSDGTYERLTLSGSGTLSTSPWDTDFAASISRVDVSSTDIAISGNPFSALGSSVVIVVPTPAYAVSYASAGFAAKLRVALGSQLFTATNEGGTAAYAITNESDLRNLAAAVNEGNDGKDKTFRQTKDITMSGDNFTPIGINTTGSNYFRGTYDGGNHDISGLKVTNNTQYTGFFGNVYYGTVKNIIFVSPSVTSTAVYNSDGHFIRVGAIVGDCNFSNINNCHIVSPTVSGNANMIRLGTIIGELTASTVTNCYFYDSNANKAIGYNMTETFNHVTNVGRAYAVYLGSGVQATGNGFTHGTDRYLSGSVTLSYSGTPHTSGGWVDTYTVNGTAIEENTFTIDTDATIAVISTPDPAHFAETAANEYTIYDAIGWDVFCEMLDDFVHTDDNGYCFDGKTVKLGNDIDITRAAGNTGYHDFTGIFDGQGHTLNVDITDTENQGTAPFRVISNATIRNLHVTGTVTGTAHASGLVGKACAGTMLIENCLVEANVSSLVGDTNGNKHCGGVVGHGFGNNSTTANTVSLTLRNVVYAGTITCDQNYIGGLQGWSDGNTLTLENCLFAGSYAGKEGKTALFHPIALRNKNKVTNLTATNVFTAVIPTVTDAQYIACAGAKVTGRTTAPAGLGDEVATYDYMNTTVYEHGIRYNGLYYVAPTFSTDDSGAYLLSNMDDWTNFCDALYDNDTWDRFSGKTVKLTASIGTTEAPVTRAAGSSYHDFCGTFNGQGNTITVSLSSSGESTALFSYVSNTKANPDDANDSPATICKLKVAGTVNVSEDTSHKYAGGLVGSCWGVVNIENCRISTVIDSHINGDGTHGGIVGRLASGTLTITGCVFDGQLLGSTTNACGGIVGYRSSGSADIYNTLFAPTALTMSATNSATFIRNATTSCHEGCYYTEAFGAVTTSENAQGKAPRTVEAGENVTIEAKALTGSETEYDVSGITAYSGGGLKRTINDETTLYYGSGDQVSLTLSNTATGAPAGYQYGGYSVSAGTISGDANPYTLTMPDENATVNVALRSTGEPVSVAYMKADGTSDTHDAIALDGTESSLGQSGQEAWYFVGTDISRNGRMTFYGDIHLILKDGCSMNVSYSGSGYVISGTNTTIYGQEDGTGELNVINNNGDGIGAENNLTINGGKVSATAIGNYKWAIASYGNLTINGGQVTANGGSKGIAVGDENGTITLGWRSADDFITANSYSGTVTLAKAFIDEDGNTYEIGAVNPSAIAGKTLHPYVPSVTLTGDANGDGYVTITDAVAVVNYILGNPSADFNKAAANVSGDVDEHGEPIISITDAVGIVNIILNNNASSAPAFTAPDDDESPVDPE